MYLCVRMSTMMTRFHGRQRRRPRLHGEPVLHDFVEEIRRVETYGFKMGSSLCVPGEDLPVLFRKAGSNGSKVVEMVWCLVVDVRNAFQKEARVVNTCLCDRLRVFLLR